MTAAAVQLDLFGEVEATEHRRRRDALTCLRDAVPEALEVVVDLRFTQSHDRRNPSACGDWAYCVCRAGLRVEAADDWWRGARERGEAWGWNRTPVHLVTWAELTGVIGQDPRRAEIARWVAGLPDVPDRWRWLTRPHELWPDPGGWHTSRLCRDHVDAQWPGRRHAWQLVLDLLTDAIGPLRAENRST